MLTTDQQYVLSLLRRALNAGGTEDLPYEDSLYVAKIVESNGILLTVYNQLPEDVKNRFHKVYLAAIKQAVVQEHEGENILRALSDAGINCIGLKGWELRKLYPSTTMRQMADLDILVRQYDYDKIRGIMTCLDFSAGTESNWKHDGYKKKEVHVEMHKRLTDDSDVIQAWEKTIWDRVSVVDANICKMSPEDYYIFHFVHLHKDFMNGSLGLRRIADTWLLQQHPVDISFVQEILGSFGMWKFHEKMVKLSRAAMGDEPVDEDSEILLTHAFTHGIYGSGKSYKVGRIVSMGDDLKSGKFKSKFAAVFLPYKRMKAQYPKLGKYPFLLPYYWVKRIARYSKRGLKKNRSRLDYSDISEADYLEMERFFIAGGVK